MDIRKINDLLDEVFAAAHAAGYWQAMYEYAEKLGLPTEFQQALTQNTQALVQRAELRDMLLLEIVGDQTVEVDRTLADAYQKMLKPYRAAAAPH